MDMLGMYPTFYVPGIGTAWVMGIIGVIHVVASHTSVGASFLFALLETKAYREDKPQLMDFIKKYGMFLLVFSYINRLAAPLQTLGLARSARQFASRVTTPTAFPKFRARHIWPVRSAVISKMRCVPTVMGKLGKTPP